MPKFQSKNFLKIQEYNSVDDSKGTKRLHGIWRAWFIVKWFTVVDFLPARSNVNLHNRAKLSRLLLHCFVNSGFPRKTNFAYTQRLIYGEKRKANVFENCTCQQVNKAKNTAGKQHSPRSWPLLTVREEFTLIFASWVIRARWQENRTFVIEFKAR